MIKVFTTLKPWLQLINYKSLVPPELTRSYLSKRLICWCKTKRNLGKHRWPVLEKRHTKHLIFMPWHQPIDYTVRCCYRSWKDSVVGGLMSLRLSTYTRKQLPPPPSSIPSWNGDINILLSVNDGSTSHAQLGIVISPWFQNQDVKPPSIWFCNLGEF